jgi:hypothetical protein
MLERVAVDVAPVVLCFEIWLLKRFGGGFEELDKVGTGGVTLSEGSTA